MLFLLYVDVFFFFFNDTATTEIYTLSLHDALPISFANSPTQSRYGPFASWANRPAAAIRSRPFHPAPSCRRSASETRSLARGKLSAGRGLIPVGWGRCREACGVRPACWHCYRPTRPG